MLELLGSVVGVDLHPDKPFLKEKTTILRGMVEWVRVRVARRRLRLPVAPLVAPEHCAGCGGELGATSTATEWHQEWLSVHGECEWKAPSPTLWVLLRRGGTYALLRRGAAPGSTLEVSARPPLPDRRSGRRSGRSRGRTTRRDSPD